MGLLPKGAGNSIYLNVREGCLARKIGEGQYEEHGGYDGIITGVRALEGEYKKEKTTELQLRVADPKTGDEVIISCTMVYGSGQPSAWAGMMLSRLIAKPNNLTKDTHLDIGVYRYNDLNCASLRIHGQEKALQGAGRLTVDQMFKAVDYLAERYGKWEREAAQPHEAHRPDDIPPPPPPEYDDSNRGNEEYDLPF